MATKSLTFDIFGRDRTASKAIRGVGSEADRVSGKFRGFGIAGGIALAAVAGAAVRFGVDSVQAFAEAEESQLALSDAFERFPKLADTNIEKIRELNTALMDKTRFDDDAIASGQAILAQYDITGKQLEELTPLLLDYAQKTGKDVPTAAEALGKAILGQGRALKDIGIDFQDTGTAAGNAAALVEALQGKVGGFAEESAGTAAGKLDQLKNKFGEIQEAVGSKLLDPLVDVMDELDDSGAIDDTATAIGGLVTAFGDLEEKTGWFSDLADDLSKVTDMADDITRFGDALSNIGNPVERGNFVNDQIDRGGLAGMALGTVQNFLKDIGFIADKKGVGAGGGGGGGGGGDINGQLEGVKTQWADFWAWMTGTAETGSEDTRRGMGGGFAAAAGDNQVFRDAQEQGFSGMWGEIVGGTTTGLGNVNTSAAGGLGVVGTTLSGMSPIAGTAFGTAWLVAQSATGTGWTGVHGRTRSGMSTAGGILGGFHGIVSGTFAGAGSWLISAGGNIVQGLVSGIAGMVGSAAQAAANLAASVVQGAKSALGIKSPSRVFRDEVGKQIGAGLALGILAQEGMVTDAVDRLTGVPDDMAVSSAGARISAIGGGAMSLEGLSISGRLEIGGDGLATIVDGRIVRANRAQQAGLETGKQAYR